MPKATNTSYFKKAIEATQRFISSPFSGPASDTAPVQPPHDPAIQEPSAPIVRQELGISQEAYWTRFELYQYNPDELITKKGYRILEKMATSDDTIAMGLNALKMMRLSSGYEIAAASDDPQDQDIADEVADNLDNMKSSLQEKLFSIMGSLDIGWSLHEKIFDFWTDGPYKGHVRLSGLKAKNPQWFNPAVDDFNNITGIVMISPPHYAGKLPHQKFLTYSAQKRYENVGGTSRIRTLYDLWYLKGIAKAALAILLKKYGKDTPIMMYPPTMSAGDKTAGLNALANLATSAAISMPAGIEIDFAKMDFNTVNGCLAVIEKADQQMTKVLLGQVSSSGTSAGQAHKGGSQQGGGTGGGHGVGGSGLQEKTLDMYLSFIGNDVANNPMAEIIKDIVDANYQGVFKYPTFKFKPLASEDLTPSVAAWTDAVSKGAVTNSADDEDHIRQILGFPSVNGKTTLRPIRFKNKITPKPPTAHEPINPAALPVAGYRPPTPSAPGLPANYAEHKHIHHIALFSEGFKPFRSLTKYEAHTDFAESLTIMEKDGSQVIAKDAADVLHKAVNALKLSAKKAVGDSKAIRNLTMSYRGELSAVLRDGLQDVAKKSMRQAKAEIAAKRKSAKFAENDLITLAYGELNAARKNLKGHLSAGKMTQTQVDKEWAHHVKDYEKTVKENGGKVSAPAVIFAEHDDLGHRPPKEVMQLIQDRAFTMAGDISDEVLKKVKQVLYDGVQSGASYKDIVYDIENKIAPYLDLTDTTGDLSGARLMTVVRTNVSSAYNDARDSIFEDPSLDGFVLAFQFSAILDSGSTAWCSSMDGKIFAIANPVWDRWTPPTFYNCRSIKIPITRADDWDGVESEEPTEQPPEW